MDGSNRSLAGLVIRHRGWIALAWIAGWLVLLPQTKRVAEALSVAAEVDGSESAEVDSKLAHRFRSPFSHSVLLVVSGIPSPAESAGERALRAIADKILSLGEVSQVVSYLDRHEDFFMAKQAVGGTYMVVGLKESARPDILVERLRRATRELETRMHGEFPDLALRWTGEVVLNADLRRVSAMDAQTSERRALPATLVLLIVAFGAIAAAFLPLVGSLLAISLTLGIATLLTRFWPLSILLQNVVTMIGLGLGIDYSLLMVSRFREEMQLGREKVDAARAALRHAGPTILLSGAAVGIGFGALATTAVNELRSVGIAGLLITGISVLVSTTLIPGLLAILGKGIEAGRFRRARPVSNPWWDGWARLVTSHPYRVLMLFGLPICALAWPARHLKIELPRGDWLPPGMESATALRTLSTMGRGTVVQTIRVIVELPRGVSVFDDAGWEAIEHYVESASAVPAVETVRTLTTIVDPLAGMTPRDLVLEQIPDAVKHAFVSSDTSSALVEIIPREGSGSEELAGLIHLLRSADAVSTTGLAGTRLIVGGLPAFDADYQAAVLGQFFRIIAGVVLATFLVLAFGFRSLLIPVKAIALNLLSVAGAFGAVVLVFQNGFAIQLVGLEEPLDGIFPVIPVLAFCVVFGLSMDYEVFLVARVRESRRAGVGERAAIASGLSHTGSLITSAAAIMIVVFGAFTLGSFVLIKMLGFALAVAVFLDATVMRLAVSPALLTIAQHWNWWPGERKRIGTSPPMGPDAGEQTPPV